VVVTLRRRILDYSLAGLLCIAPFLILRANLADPSRLSRFDHAVLRITSPIQAAVAWIVEGLGGLATGYVWLVDVADENDELRAENHRLHREIAALRRQVDDTAALEALVALKKRTSAETLGARVVAASLNPTLRTVRLKLDRGEGDVAPGMPVVTADDALVGRIQRVYGRYSDVLLTVDPDSSIEVIVTRTGSRGVLTGLSRDDAYRARVEYLERDKEVAVGDKVVTSGLGAMFPAGLPVGEIVEVSTKAYGLYQEVEVAPAVDFSGLRTVLVVVSAPPAPDPQPSELPADAAASLRAF
jgi:rod shape-determining protein MreC